MNTLENRIHNIPNLGWFKSSKYMVEMGTIRDNRNIKDEKAEKWSTSDNKQESYPQRKQCIRLCIIQESCHKSKKTCHLWV